MNNDEMDELLEDYKTCSFWPETRLETTLLPWLRLRNAVPGLISALREAREALERQYEFNVGQIAKQAELESALAQSRGNDVYGEGV